jgi:riboflavin kinase/FMN adenylyltransferase
MQIHFGLDSWRAEWSASVVCIGTFDGVHVGHRRVIGRALEVAASREEPVVAVTFDRHPLAIIAPERAPKAVCSLRASLDQLERLGVPATVVLPFDAVLQATPAERFFNAVLRDQLHATEIVVGHDFAFGFGREGTPTWLAGRIETHVVPPFELMGRRVSSSSVRAAVEAGDVAAAADLLGRPFAVEGIVVGGQKLGRQLGYPTVNLARTFDQVTPADGIYAGWTETAKGKFKVACSIGMRPTVGGQSRTVEAFLIDYPGDSLYGAAVNLNLLQRLRGEVHFATLDELVVQMGQDVELAKSVVTL